MLYRVLDRPPLLAEVSNNTSHALSHVPQELCSIEEPIEVSMAKLQGYLMKQMLKAEQELKERGGVQLEMIARQNEVLGPSTREIEVSRGLTRFLRRRLC